MPTNPLRCIVVTPEETVLETETDFVALPLYDGELGVARGHAPMIGRLGYGELRIKKNGDTTRMYVDGGFVQVDDNVVSVLTNRAMPPEKLDAQALQEEVAAAVKLRVGGEDALTLRTRNLERARGMLRVAYRGK